MSRGPLGRHRPSLVSRWRLERTGRAAESMVRTVRPRSHRQRGAAANRGRFVDRQPPDTAAAVPMSASEPRDTLTGWKEIAAYLGKSVRTAHRWKTELGLPVHRMTFADG